MANFFVKAFDFVVDFFKSGTAKKDAQLALQYAQEALPYIKIAGDVITGLTPTNIDNVAWAAIQAKYPALFNGSIQTPASLQSYALGVASSLLEAKYPQLGTTVAVLATQLAYVQAKSDGTAPVAPSAPSAAGVILKSVPPAKSPLAV